MLRLLDFGVVPGLLSQAIWHAVAEAVEPGDPPVLCLMTPSEPYISIGYHRRVDELDLPACAERGFAVYRRRAGGGPVLCDDGQLFFTLIAPAVSFPARLDRAWARAMEPAVAAFRALGIPASLTPSNDIVATGKKVSGVGAAAIGQAQVFVGNVIVRFDREAFASCLAIPPGARAEAVRLMHEHLATAEEASGRTITHDEAAAALIDSYASAFGGMWPDRLREIEERMLCDVERRLLDPAWIFAERAPMPRRIKIRAGVSLLLLGSSWVSVVEDKIVRASIGDGWAPAHAVPALERALQGLRVEHRELDAAARRVSGEPALAGAIVEAYGRGA